MPCTVTAFSVKIASAGDAAMELFVAREVIGEWNARHALEQKRILLPLGTQDKAGCFPVDVLVDFFIDTPGATGEPDEDVAEIEKQLAQGRPALVYFSEGRVDLTGKHLPGGRALDEFRKKYAGATIDSYGDEKEFRAKFAKQLDATIDNHAYFKAVAAAPNEKVAMPVTRESLSESAQQLLIEACDDYDSCIGRVKGGGMLKIQTNGKQLVENNEPATIAKWESALQELLTADLIHDAGHNGQLFQLGPKGIAFLKTIGKAPVGYIAELGGM
jgi:hypothetical protein